MRAAVRLVVAVALAGTAACSVRAAQPSLRVCADPNNLPFSNRAGEGFENQIASLLAADRHARLEYTWWAQRRGFVRHTLDAGLCDVIVGVPQSFEPARTTHPYYRSSYVFVSRAQRRLGVRSFDDARLRGLRVGVQMIGDDFSNSPPAHALASRGIVKNVVGYSVYGDYARPSPLSGIVAAVDRGDIDVAVVWGPPAGYFAQASHSRLELTPVAAERQSASLPFAFDISMGVRRDDATLARALDEFLIRRRVEIDRILDHYGVPRVEAD